MSLSPEQRAALVAARTVALARDHLDLAVDPAAVATFGNTGAAVAVDGRALVDPGDSPGGGLGAALAWAARHEAIHLDLLVEADSGRDTAILARQALLFEPSPTVWQVEGSKLIRVAPAPYEPIEAPSPATAEQQLLLEQAGVEIVVEHGAVLGEVNGLEIAQVVVDDAGVATLQVGIGRFDREAFALIHGELSPPAALAAVVDQVRAVRAPGAEPHPINRLARDRWLRRQVIADPTLVGAVELAAVESTRLRSGLRDTGLAVALGRRGDGATMVVAASVGVDLDAVPDSADARARHAPDAVLVVVVPRGDAHPITRALVDRLAVPADVVEIDPEWSR